MAHRVSLSLPVCNGERFIAAAVRSLLAQSFEDFELIITDNASTDATELICRDFARRDALVKYVRNDRNIGALLISTGFKLASANSLWCAHDDFIGDDFIRNACALMRMT
jgi:glycosyltransferase involved in cell wall biosynthesis